MSYIPYGKQSISQSDIDEVVKVLQSEYLTQGPAIAQFEDAVSRYCGAKYAVAVSSATAGLHISCLSLGLSHGDLLWTVPNTFVASANCALYCGADVDFVDIDPKTYNISISSLKKKLEAAEISGRLPKVLIPVHFAGQSCDMEAINELSKQYGFFIIEDAAHAIGSSYENHPVGSCLWSDLVVFSFHPVKIITSGEGGMILTNRQDLYEKLIRLRTHGITRSEEFMTCQSEGPWYYQQLELGYHYRMTDIQAALGASQMSKLDLFVSKRHDLVARYNEKLKDFPLETPYCEENTHPSWHLYVVKLKTDLVSLPRKEIFTRLRLAGIGVNVHYIPVHLHPFYRNMGFKDGDFPESESFYGKSITLPLYSDLSFQQQDEVVKVLEAVLS